jgi:NLR family CARD domain-containing protein 3
MSIQTEGKHHDNLSVLDLGFNSVGNIGCESLALNCIAGNFSLQTLYLSGNHIGETGALAIAGAILQGSGLLRLHLTANAIGPTGMKAIACAIATNDANSSLPQGLERIGLKTIPSIEELHLGSSGILPEGFFAIPGMLVSNLTLRSLCVSDNEIGDPEIVLLAQALTQNKHIPIEMLDLSFNNITCNGVEFLMNAIWGSQTIRVLKLDNNKIKDRGAQLCAVVLTSIPLEGLDLSFNRQITTTGVKALMRNLSENRSLLSLGLSGISIDQSSSKALSYALAYNSSLRTMHLDNCSVSYASQRHVLAGIVSNQKGSLHTLTGFDLGRKFECI